MNIQNDWNHHRVKQKISVPKLHLGFQYVPSSNRRTYSPHQDYKVHLRARTTTSDSDVNGFKRCTWDRVEGGIYYCKTWGNTCASSLLKQFACSGFRCGVCCIEGTQIWILCPHICANSPGYWRDNNNDNNNNNKKTMATCFVTCLLWKQKQHIK